MRFFAAQTVLRCYQRTEGLPMLRYFTVFVTGGVCYGLVEIMWRGHTHPTMIVTGGLCLVAISLVETHMKQNVFVKAAVGAAVITFVELLAGLILNRLLGMGVWDYSSVPLNLLGQICLPYSLLWYLLSIPAIYLCRLLGRFVFEKYPLIFG